MNNKDKKPYNKIFVNLSFFFCSIVCGIFGFGAAYIFGQQSLPNNYDDSISNLLSKSSFNSIIGETNNLISFNEKNSTTNESEQKPKNPEVKKDFNKKIDIQKLKSLNAEQTNKSTFVLYKKENINYLDFSYRYQSLKFIGNTKANSLNDSKYCKIFDHTVNLKIIDSSGTGWFFDFVLPQNGKYPTKWFLITAYHVVANQLSNINTFSLFRENKQNTNCNNNITNQISTSVQNIQTAENVKGKLIYDGIDFYGPIFFNKSNKKFNLKNENNKNENIPYKYFKDLAVLSVEFSSEEEAKKITNNIYEKYFSTPQGTLPEIIEHPLKITNTKNVIQQMADNQLNYSDYIKNKLFIGGYPNLTTKYSEFKELNNLWFQLSSNKRKNLVKNFNIRNPNIWIEKLLIIFENSIQNNNKNADDQKIEKILTIIKQIAIEKCKKNSLNSISCNEEVKEKIKKWLLENWLFSLQSFKSNIENENNINFFTTNEIDKSYLNNTFWQKTGENQLSSQNLNKKITNSLSKVRKHENVVGEAGYQISWNGKGSYKIGLSNYSNFESLFVSKNNDSSLFIENISGLVNAPELEGSLGNCESGKIENSMLVCYERNRLYRWGHYYAINNVGLSSGASGSLVLDKDGDAIGVYVAHNSQNNFGFIEPLRSSAINNEDKIISPEYDLINGSPWQVKSYKSEILKHLTNNDKTWLSSTNNWGKN